MINDPICPWWINPRQMVAIRICCIVRLPSIEAFWAVITDNASTSIAAGTQVIVLENIVPRTLLSVSNFYQFLVIKNTVDHCKAVRYCRFY